MTNNLEIMGEEADPILGLPRKTSVVVCSTQQPSAKSGGMDVEEIIPPVMQLE